MRCDVEWRRLARWRGRTVQMRSAAGVVAEEAGRGEEGQRHGAERQRHNGLQVSTVD